MLVSLIYFICFLLEVCGVAVLVVSLTRDVWYTFKGSFAIYGTVEGYGNLWKKCYRLVDQQLTASCESTKPISTPGTD